ncbi:MAG TPA: glycosyltransferase family 2 protein [Chitinophagaceae bacterium]|nr:glycosyltransferase family 2 protein [Chitinophagaceae bacterium]
MQLSVIIVNYNVKYFLEHCLGSVEKAAKNIETEIFVVDNNSADGSQPFFKDKFPGVRFIWNEKNEGFSKANNRALALATGEYILFLNPDTLVAEDAFEKCISFIKTKNNAVACGVKMINGSGVFLKESKRGFPSPVTSFYKLSGLSRLFPRSKVFGKYHLGFLDENATHEVDVLAGAFMMVPKKILDKTGGFDEDFFMYGEDIDLSYRIQQAGYKNFYFAETCVIHFKGESTNKESLKYVKLFYNAMSIFARKHLGSAKAGIYNFFIQLAIYFRAGISGFSRFAKKLFSSKKGNGIVKGRTLLIGAQADKISLSQLLKNTETEKQMDRIDPDETSDVDGFIKKINTALRRSNTDEIIFCEQSITLKKIIALLPLMPRRLSVRFFNGNTLLEP